MTIQQQYRTYLLCVLLGLAGCAGGGKPSSTCEVFSPAEIPLPTTQDDQRVETQSSGDPTGSAAEQHCP
ncbi:hypothetical protein JQX08_16540 [Pseudomonas sp. UL073]|uniref:Secreted protein n=1 Tax=Zestomonas insulae TaxID=2809017 RepID=A0ABS2IGX0_9GAMM|nr:hypothetical protein [Pseudomonas insulae]MBM7062321.1 hypothetical protein [Pseudomonas insulae]